MEQIESARRLSRANQLNAALLTYGKAYELHPSAWILISIGRVQQKLGHLDDAIATYHRYLDSSQEQPAEGTAAAREYLKQAEQDLLVARASERRAAAEKPIYKKWWFWVAIGGAAVAAGAITAGVVVATRPADRMIPANTFMITF